MRVWIVRLRMLFSAEIVLGGIRGEGLMSDVVVWKRSEGRAFLTSVVVRGCMSGLVGWYWHYHWERAERSWWNEGSWCCA